MSEEIKKDQAEEEAPDTELSLDDLEEVSGGVDGKPKAYKCLICGKLYPSRLQLLAHATTHLKKGS